MIQSRDPSKQTWRDMMKEEGATPKEQEVVDKNPKLENEEMLPEMGGHKIHNWGVNLPGSGRKFPGYILSPILKSKFIHHSPSTIQ